MEPIHLCHVWDYTDIDRRFWAEHLEDWLPRRIIDAHRHVDNPSHRLVPMTEEKRRQYWVAEVNDAVDAPATERCMRTVFPGREVSCIAMGSPSLDFDVEAGNHYLHQECPGRGWHSLAIVRPEWDAARIDRELSQPGVIGVKPYYTLISPSRLTRDSHREADIFDFLPHHILEVLDHRHAWLTLHVPKADRLPHPDNIRQVRQIRERYPNVVLVIAHLGRCYTEPHARAGLPPLADDPGIYFDLSAVLNPAAHRIALDQIGPDRLLYGTDNPVFYMRGRRQWHGREYINRTNHDFFFNKQHEPPEIEAAYTLYMYEALYALKQVCEELALNRSQTEGIFFGNADRLIRSVQRHKTPQED